MKKIIEKTVHPLQERFPDTGTVTSQEGIRAISACVRTRVLQNIERGMRRNAALLEAVKYCKTVRS